MKTDILKHLNKALGVTGKKFRTEDLDIITSLYDIIQTKGNSTTIKDIAKIETEVEGRRLIKETAEAEV